MLLSYLFIFVTRCGVAGVQSEGCVITFFKFSKSALSSLLKSVNSGYGYSITNTLLSGSVCFFPVTLNRSQLQKFFGIFYIHEGHITLQRIKQCVQL